VRRAAALPFALLLSSCSIAFKAALPFDQPQPSQSVEVRVQEEREAVTQVLSDECFARAAKFRGLVAIPCEDIARRISP
jgi:hypothetical protein